MKKDIEKQLDPEDFDAMTKEDVVSFLLAERIKKEGEISTLETNIRKLEHNSTQLQEMLKNMADYRFGKKAEKTNVLAQQLAMTFDEAEVTASTETDMAEEFEVEETITVKKKKGRKKPSESSPDLEVKEIVHAMDELLDEGYEKIGEKVIEKLRYQPATMWIDRHIYPVYEKERDDGCSDIQTQYQGHEFLSGSPASEALVARIINDKYVKALPLYRIENTFKDHKADISRQTLSNWLIQTSKVYLNPLYKRMKAQLLALDIIHADETPVKVLHHQDGSTNEKSTMWLYRSGSSFPNIMIYEYQPGRKQIYPETFLQGYTGYLQTDGYQVYKNLTGMVQVGCLAHGRRQFAEALKVMDSKTEGSRIASELLKTVNRIFSEDRQWEALGYEARAQKRREVLEPLFDQFKRQLDEASDKILPNSKLGKAIQYNLNQLESFKRVLLDGRLDLTNNRAERGIKPFVIGRKNWLFMNRELQ